MPDFHVDGDPAGVRSRAVAAVTKGQAFFDTGDALARIGTEGWTGRAADHFREAHELEPERWTRAGNGFLQAGNALEVYAAALEDAQATAAWAEREHARGDQVSEDARAAYDADVSSARATQQGYQARGIPYDLTIVPFSDPGQAIRDQAVAEMQRARHALEQAAQTCAGEVRAGCRDAPEKPGWLASQFAGIGGFLAGAGEAVWDLVTMSNFSPINMLQDSWKLAHGDLTPEELAAKYELTIENAKDMAQAAWDDPGEFGKQLGKSMLDWDTWADDPARALGHLVPDAIAAVFSGGTATAATRGAKGLTDVVEALGAMGRHADDLADVGTAGRRFDDLDGLDGLDGPGSPLDDLGTPDHLHEHDSGRGFRSVEDQLRDPSYSPDNRDIIGRDYDVLGGRESPEAFEREFRRDTGDAAYPRDWRWPPHDGKVPGTEAFPESHEVPPLDRIGGPRGEYFADDGAPMADRSLPPDRLNFDRGHWSVEQDHPALRSGEVRVERSEVAPWFGQEGGGWQYRFLDAEGKPLSQGDLADLGIIRERR